MFKARTSAETVRRNSSTNDEESTEITQNHSKLSLTDYLQRARQKSGEEKSGESEQKSGESNCGSPIPSTSIGKRVNQNEEKDEEPTLKKGKWNTSLNVSLYYYYHKLK